MSNWDFLNRHRVGEGQFASTPADGFNGAFAFALPGVAALVRCIASNGMGWEHVSVSLLGAHKPPSWDIMCQVRDLFWDEEQWVVQFHPPNSQYVNNHPGCLHLWRSTDKEQPTPLALMVGVKGAGEIKSCDEARTLYDRARRQLEAQEGIELPPREKG